MIGITAVLAVFGLLGVCFAPTRVKLKDGEKIGKFVFPIFAVVCFAIKLILGGMYYGHESDMGCFSGWAQMIYEGGFSNFYTSEAFTDYPPGYMYILWVLGAVKSVFSVGDAGFALMLKIPAIAADVFTGCLAYGYLKRNITEKYATVLSGLYMLNPMTIVNSSLWGQTDSVYVFFAVSALIALADKKTLRSFLLYAFCLFVKPQAAIFAPIFIFSVFEDVFLPTFNGKKLGKYVGCGFCALILVGALALPFGIKNVVGQYVDTLKSYPYMSVNAFNLWGALGKNWADVTIGANILGTLFIVAITVGAAFVFFKIKDNSKYFKTAGFLIFATFMLSVKMHERYSFAAAVMFLLAYGNTKNGKMYNLFVLTSLSQFFNAAWILFIYEKNPDMYFKSPMIAFASVLNILLLGYMVFVLSEKKVNVCHVATETEKEERAVFTQKDFLIMMCITLIYSGFALYDLGDLKSPKTSFELMNGEKAEIVLSEESYVDSLMLYIGADDIENDFTVEASDNEGKVVFRKTSEEGSAFYWNEIEIGESVKTISFTTGKDSLEIFEAVPVSAGKALGVESSTPKELTDEKEMLPKRVSFRNSTYFDEIYHARTAYEFLAKKDVYEWTHPPLGKVMISLGIKVFGMTPFGWRIVGTLFGILMLPVIYVIGKRILKTTLGASACCIMLAFDFMHFAQTRIATIDVYVTFFIMMMYLFMYEYYSMDLDNVSLKKRFRPLLLSGISFGLGAASKWTAMYAAVGLAVLFFAKSGVWLKKSGKYKEFFKTAAFCVGAFVVIPVCIYALSYIPYLNAVGNFRIGEIIKNQKDMFMYHGKTVLNSTHPYSSKWYSWPVMYRPIWYYSGEISSKVKEGISSFGNPAVWWTGIASFAVCVYMGVVKKDKKALFMLVGYLSCLLPWVFVGRTTYIYHYFPCVPFVVLMNCYVMSMAENKKAVIGVFSGLTVILFLMFYPVLSGMPVSVWYVEKFLRWFSSWVLI